MIVQRDGNGVLQLSSSTVPVSFERLRSAAATGDPVHALIVTKQAGDRRRVLFLTFLGCFTVVVCVVFFVGYFLLE